MSNIVRDSDVVEISEPPFFSYGEKVKAKLENLGSQVKGKLEK